MSMYALYGRIVLSPFGPIVRGGGTSLCLHQRSLEADHCLRCRSILRLWTHWRNTCLAICPFFPAQIMWQQAVDSPNIKVVQISSSCKINGHFSIQNYHFSGAILHDFCIFNRKLKKTVGRIIIYNGIVQVVGHIGAEDDTEKHDGVYHCCVFLIMWPHFCHFFTKTGAF